MHEQLVKMIAARLYDIQAVLIITVAAARAVLACLLSEELPLSLLIVGAECCTIGCRDLRDMVSSILKRAAHFPLPAAWTCHHPQDIVNA